MFDIYAFVKEAMRVEESVEPEVKIIDPQQKEFLDAVSLIWKAKFFHWKGYAMTPAMKGAYKKMGVSVKAGKGTGKDACMAWVKIWALTMWGHTNMKIYVTAPNEAQILRDITWPEIQRWLDAKDKDGNYCFAGRDDLMIQKELIYTKRDGGGETDKKDGIIKQKVGSFIAPKVAPAQANDQEAAKTLDGLHETFMLICITEADGVREPVFTALETTLTRPMNMCVMAFNPTRNTGFAAKTHRDETEREHWTSLTQNAEDSSLVTRESIEKKKKYGENSNYYRVYVKGEFPLTESECIIKWDWLQNAVRNDIEDDEEYPVIVGIDPAGDGSDQTCCVARRKGVVFAIERFSGEPGKETIGEKCLAFLHKVKANDCIVLKNGVGADVYLYLLKYFHKVKGISEVNRSDHPGKAGIKYKNKRAEMWDLCADAFENGLMKIPNDKDLIAELNASRWLEEKAEKQVEAKKLIKKRLGYSPDSADAVVATFAKGYDYARMIGRKARRRVMESDERDSWMTA